MTDPSYALAIENVQLLSRRARREDKEARPVVCSAYAAKNRVSFRRLTNDSVEPASAIPIPWILPSQDDFDSLRRRMKVIVQRILVSNLKCFEDAADAVLDHIPHKYSRQAARRVNV